MRELLTITDLDFAYVSATGAAVTVFQNLSLKVNKGQTIRIVGPNGCGKSTLLDLIAGRLTPSGGTMQVNGQCAERGRIPIAYLRQKPLDNVSPNLTVGENVTFACDARLPISRVRRRAFRTQGSIEDLLGKYGMSVAHLRWNQEVGTLSGGQMQWLGLAMTILTTPELLLLDEPTAFLDVNRSELLFQTILRFQREVGCAIILVSHDALDDTVTSAEQYDEHYLA